MTVSSCHSHRPDLAPEAARAGLLEKLVADIRKRGNHTSAGDVGYTYVVQALTATGRSDVLFDMTNQTEAPSYGAQLTAGATSLTEAWGADPRSSENHLMLGHIEQWFYAGLAGIRPDLDVAGLRRIDIRPEMVGNLTSVDASWETFRGPLAIHWWIDGEAFKMDVSVPPGITANVFLPAASANQVQESGEAAPKAPGVRLVGQRESRTVFEIGSGDYEFAVTGFHR